MDILVVVITFLITVVATLAWPYFADPTYDVVFAFGLGVAMYAAPILGVVAGLIASLVYRVIERRRGNKAGV